ncbi:unnamed protein product, partial [Porites lobata]
WCPVRSRRPLKTAGDNDFRVRSYHNRSRSPRSVTSGKGLALSVGSRAET